MFDIRLKVKVNNYSVSRALQAVMFVMNFVSGVQTERTDMCQRQSHLLSAGVHV